MDKTSDILMQGQATLLSIFERSFKAMGSIFRIRIDVWENRPLSDPSIIETVFHSLAAETEAIEQSLSRFRQDSELTRLNSHVGMPQPVSQHMLAVLQLAQTMTNWTTGAFDPRILSVMEHIGYHGAPLTPLNAATEIVTSNQPVDLFEAIDAKTIRLLSPIDLGGIGKGYTADQLAGLIDHSFDSSVVSGYIVDAGGDIVVSGCQHTGEAWTIGVENPLAPEELAAAITPPLFRIAKAAICTSSIWRKSWVQDGRQVHHIIDPRSNAPVDTPLMSVTAMANSAALAETVTKYVFLRGNHASAFWTHVDPAFLTIDRDGQMVTTEAIQPYITWTAAES